VPVGVLPGALSLDQSGYQAAHALGPVRQHPLVLHRSDGKLHDVNVLDLLLPEPGAFYVVDRGYIDFERLHHLHEAGKLFCDAR
jgi:hypothetical protein